MKKLSVIAFFFISFLHVYGQSNFDYLYESVRLLTSSEFKGRGYIYGGADSTARYIKNAYREIGLSALSYDFQQSFLITAFGRINEQSSISINGRPYAIWSDFTINPYVNDWTRGQFIGQHHLYPYYKNDSVFLYRDRDAEDCLIRVKLISEKRIFQTILEGDTLADKFFGRKHTTACLHSYLQQPNMNLYPSPMMSRKLKQIANINTSNSVKETIFVDIQRDTSSYLCSNIIGRLNVRSSVDSIILVTAHYDHLGQRATSYYPGANDNASGVGVMLELANWLSIAVDEGWQPRHNIVFVAFAAEEYGLLGSEYFVQSNLIDTSLIKCVLNLDMIGGLGATLKEHSRSLYLLKSANVQHTYIEYLLEADSVNAGVDFLLDGNAKYLRYSDQASFIRRDIPSLFLFSGEDGVIHTVNDTADKLNFEKMESLVEVLYDWLKRN
ncbi:M28 family peptidase [Carboxylicivirga mesophila]|uniref:M28 family peptidase n=1 Tax=Carboxylicivirga mesophila TaxID=1166478 RepID=A0ABS5KDT9_9BACT|nr:M28 family peptidase [Carboxylicivirga mesophila]MBS2213193.1 M28 family peptidase [Carboxylicivirga mesophila]